MVLVTVPGLPALVGRGRQRQDGSEQPSQTSPPKATPASGPALLPSQGVTAQRLRQQPRQRPPHRTHREAQSLTLMGRQARRGTTVSARRPARCLLGKGGFGLSLWFCPKHATSDFQNCGSSNSTDPRSHVPHSKQRVSVRKGKMTLIY